MQTSSDQAPRLAPLSGVGFIALNGADSDGFLHGQLSQNVEAPDASNAPVAAWHSAAGKVEIIVRMLRLDEGWLLVTDNELVGPAIAGLQRFVLRDEVRIGDGGDKWQAAALVGESNEWLREHDIGLGSDPGRRVDANGVIWLRLGPTLVHAIGSPSAIAELESTLPHATSDEAALEEVALGLPRLTPALQGRFVPQMLNLDLLGALDETKGCYPGQEVIARTQNLGTVKRRMLRFSADLNRAPEIGSAIVEDAGATVGEVIRAAVVEGRVELLALTQLASADRALHCEAEPAVALRTEPLPYAGEATLRPPV